MRDFVTCLSRAAFKVLYQCRLMHLHLRRSIPDVVAWWRRAQIGIVKKRVPRAAVRKLADEMFAVAKRGGGDHGISAQDFVDWARAHVVGQALVKSMESVSGQAGGSV